MDIWRLLGAALRRWYLLVALLAVSGLAAWSAGERTAPEYTATASALLVPASVQDERNPYADTGTAAQSVTIVLGSGAVRGEMLQQGLSADYELSNISRTPILQYSVRAASPEVAVQTAAALLERTAGELETRQADSGVAPASRVSVTPISPAALTDASTRGQLQAQVAVFGVGAVVSFLAAVFLDDALLLWRQARARRLAESNDTARPRGCRTDEEARTGDDSQPEGVRAGGQEPSAGSSVPPVTIASAVDGSPGRQRTPPLADEPAPAGQVGTSSVSEQSHAR